MGLKEDFLELSPSKCLLGGFLICVVYYFLVFDKGQSILDQVTAAQADIADKTERLAKVEAAMNNKIAFEQQVIALEKDFVELLKFFPVRLDMIDVQKEITHILDKNGTKLVSLKESQVVNRFPGYIESGVDIETSSDFHEIMNFLSAVTKMNKVVDFRAMDFIGQKTTEDDRAPIKFKMQFSIFSQDPSAGKKTTEASGGTK